jgi:ankyrin repeat protein
LRLPSHSRLIAAGADANATDYDQRTALHIAGADGNLAAVKVLVEQGKARTFVKDR